MSIRERRTVCLILVCDGCGDAYDGFADYQPHFASADDARDEATDDGEWHTDGEHDWCGPCHLRRSDA